MNELKQAIIEYLASEFLPVEGWGEINIYEEWDEIAEDLIKIFESFQNGNYISREIQT